MCESIITENRFVAALEQKWCVLISNLVYIISYVLTDAGEIPLWKERLWAEILLVKPVACIIVVAVIEIGKVEGQASLEIFPVLL